MSALKQNANIDFIYSQMEPRHWAWSRYKQDSDVRFIFIQRISVYLSVPLKCGRENSSIIALHSTCDWLKAVWLSFAGFPFLILTPKFASSDLPFHEFLEGKVEFLVILLSLTWPGAVPSSRALNNYLLSKWTNGWINDIFIQTSWTTSDLR